MIVSPNAYRIPDNAKREKGQNGTDILLTQQQMQNTLQIEFGLTWV